MTSPEAAYPLQASRVVVIDDSRSIQGFVVNLLREAGYDAEGALDGISGLGLIESSEPDVILLDVEMPGMNGLQVLDRLACTQHLFAIIICTTHSEKDVIVDAFARGADDYIVKPFDDNELIARVAAAERSVALKRSLLNARRRADASLAELRETQARLIEEKKLHAVSRLAAGVAHEINNPLGYIQSNLNMLGRYAEFLLTCVAACQKKGAEGITGIDGKKLENIKQDFHPLLHETQQGVDRIASIVACFKRLEQGAGGTREVQKEDLNSIVRALLGIIAPTMPQGGILVQELTPEPLPVLGTLGMLNMALENLVKNAVEAIGSSGTITVSTGRDQTGVYCAICDTGPGISEDIRPLVFEPFFTTKSESRHFGLGLTIAESFIGAHGGAIEIETPSDGGACLKVSLPAANGHARASVNER